MFILVILLVFFAWPWQGSSKKTAGRETEIKDIFLRVFFTWPLSSKKTGYKKNFFYFFFISLRSTPLWGGGGGAPWEGGPHPWEGYRSSPARSPSGGRKLGSIFTILFCLEGILRAFFPNSKTNPIVIVIEKINITTNP